MVLGSILAVIGSGLLTRIALEIPTAQWAAYIVVTGVGIGLGVNLPYTALQLALRCVLRRENSKWLISTNTRASERDIPVGNCAYLPLCYMWRSCVAKTAPYILRSRDELFLQTWRMRASTTAGRRVIYWLAEQGYSSAHKQCNIDTRTGRRGPTIWRQHDLIVGSDESRLDGPSGLDRQRSPGSARSSVL